MKKNIAITIFLFILIIDTYSQSIQQSVVNITGVPHEAVINVPLTLTGEIISDNINHNTIEWSIKRGNESRGSINGNQLIPVSSGTIVVTATVPDGRDTGINYTQDFYIRVIQPVTGITGVPTSAVVGIPLTLTAAIEPDFATNILIDWSIKPGSSGSINGNQFIPDAAGVATVTATIINGLGMGANYTQDFDITVIQPVTGITGVPTSAVIGVPLALTGTVQPNNASNKTIEWSISVSQGSIDGNQLIPTVSGTVTVTAIIINGLGEGSYIQRFAITVVQPVTDITRVPTSTVVGMPLLLTSVIEPYNATNKAIEWSIKPGSSGSINGNQFTPDAAGVATVTATIINGIGMGTNYTRDFDITVIQPVTGITGVPTSAVIGVPLALTGTVQPENATNKTIEWGIASWSSGSITGAELALPDSTVVGITATIKDGLAVGVDYVQDFTLRVIRPVTNISGVPTSVVVGVPLTLVGTVEPYNASNKVIQWSIKQGSSGSINGNQFIPDAAGVATVTATIINGIGMGENYTQDFDITVIQPVTGITGVPTEMIFDTPLTLTGTVQPDNATNKTIEWGIASWSSGNITGVELAAGYGNTVGITAKIIDGLGVGFNYTQNFNITVLQPVSNIINVPNTVTVGKNLMLSGTVTPFNVINRTIQWSLKDGQETDATIEDNVFSATTNGTVTITATIINGLGIGRNYTQDFVITVLQPVENISGMPTAAVVGVPIILTGEVEPVNAKNKTIVWSIPDSNSASVDGNRVTPWTGGTLAVTATIADGLDVNEDYTQDFFITIIQPVTNITNVPKTITLGTNRALNGKVEPSNATNRTIKWSVKEAGETGGTINGNTITATAEGAMTVTATITDGLAIGANYTQDFIINVRPPLSFYVFSTFHIWGKIAGGVSLFGTLFLLILFTKTITERKKLIISGFEQYLPKNYSRLRLIATICIAIILGILGILLILY